MPFRDPEQSWPWGCEPTDRGSKEIMGRQIRPADESGSKSSSKARRRGDDMGKVDLVQPNELFIWGMLGWFLLLAGSVLCVPKQSIYPPSLSPPFVPPFLPFSLPVLPPSLPPSVLYMSQYRSCVGPAKAGARATSAYGYSST